MIKLIFKTAALSSIFLFLVLYLVPSIIYFNFRIHFNFSILSYLGFGLFAIGIFFGLWSILNFVKVGFGTPAPIDPPKIIVMSGPYKMTRNPMYFGMTLSILGEGIFMNSIGIIIYGFLFLIFTYKFVAGKEEVILKKKFGKKYEDYLKKVPFYFPKINKDYLKKILNITRHNQYKNYK